MLNINHLRLFGLFGKLIMHYRLKLSLIKYWIIRIYLRCRGLWHVIILEGNDFLNGIYPLVYCNYIKAYYIDMIVFWDFLLHSFTLTSQLKKGGIIKSIWILGTNVRPIRQYPKSIRKCNLMFKVFIIKYFKDTSAKTFSNFHNYDESKVVIVFMIIWN